MGGDAFLDSIFGTGAAAEHRRKDELRLRALRGSFDVAKRLGHVTTKEKRTDHSTNLPWRYRCSCGVVSAWSGSPAMTSARREHVREVVLRSGTVRVADGIRQEVRSG